MRYYIIAGEASGDLHGSNLIKELLLQDPQAQIQCWGGDKMQAAGGRVVKHINELAYMGFWEVLRHLPVILRNLAFCKKDILEFKPDVVILIDYPGFNFRLFKFLKTQGLKTFYYISPQLWAWKKGRVKQVKKYVDRLFVIFPFEKEFYAQHGVTAHFVGHPLLDEIRDYDTGTTPKQKMIALVPGSRKQEISYLLPEYLKVLSMFPEYRFVVTGMSALGENFYKKIMADAPVELVMDNTYEVLRQATAAVVTSGTATLETALYRVPQVVCYKGSWISYFIIRALIDKSIGFICIVNLIARKKVVEELIQADVNQQSIAAELKKIISGSERTQMLEDYTQLSELLGQAGASKRVAALMIKYLQE